MADSVAPVVRGEFLYRDVLLVDCGGEGKRHPRAAPSEIKDLLNGKFVKDQVAHFYEAQLIHYGLQRSKDKNTAKVRLQQAIAQGNLKAQPKHLADMETSMKKEYSAALRKATKGQADAGKGKKRARDEELESTTKKTKISVKVGDISIDINQAGASESKKQRTTKTAPTKAVTMPKTPTSARPKQTARKSAGRPTSAYQDVSGEWRYDPRNDPDNVFQRSSATPTTPASTRPSAPYSISSSQDFPGGSRSDPRDHPENVFQRSSTTASSPVKREPGIKREPTTRRAPTIKRASPIKHEGYLFDSDAMDTRADISSRQLSITGVYNLSCPQLTEQLPEEANNFRLFICVDTESGITWGGFELAMKTGNIKMDDIDFSRKVSFGWRARDSWEGDLRFGKGCFGDIEFDGNGNVRGMFHGLFNESMEFVGHRRPGPLWAGKSSYKFKQEWDAYVKEAYGR